MLHVGNLAISLLVPYFFSRVCKSFFLRKRSWNRWKALREAALPLPLLGGVTVWTLVGPCLALDLAVIGADFKTVIRTHVPVRSFRWPPVAGASGAGRGAGRPCSQQGSLLPQPAPGSAGRRRPAVAAASTHSAGARAERAFGAQHRGSGAPPTVALTHSGAGPASTHSSDGPSYHVHMGTNEDLMTLAGAAAAGAAVAVLCTGGFLGAGTGSEAPASPPGSPVAATAATAQHPAAAQYSYLCEPYTGQKVVKGDTAKNTPRGRTGRQARVVHFIRHAQGTHNIAVATEGEAAYANWKYRDARLTEVGREQARGAAPTAAKMRFDTVLVSPLSRTLQTADLVLPPSCKSKMVQPAPRSVLSTLPLRFPGHPPPQSPSRCFPPRCHARPLVT
eukprot:COSAG01_NODE_12392_length_1748_cov_2.859231_2_plen_391_part_00